MAQRWKRTCHCQAHTQRSGSGAPAAAADSRRPLMEARAHSARWSAAYKRARGPNSLAPYKRGSGGAQTTNCAAKDKCAPPLHLSCGRWASKRCFHLRLLAGEIINRLPSVAGSCAASSRARARARTIDSGRPSRRALIEGANQFAPRRQLEVAATFALAARSQFGSLCFQRAQLDGPAQIAPTGGPFRQHDPRACTRARVSLAAARLSKLHAHKWRHLDATLSPRSHYTAASTTAAAAARTSGACQPSIVAAAPSDTRAPEVATRAQWPAQTMKPRCTCSPDAPPPTTWLASGFQIGAARRWLCRSAPRSGATVALLSRQFARRSRPPCQMQIQSVAGARVGQLAPTLLLAAKLRRRIN